MENQSPEVNLFQRYAPVIKAMVILMLAVILLIPAVMLQDLIRERHAYQQSVTASINDQWGKSQTVTGPVLVVPYRVPKTTDTQAAGAVLYAYLLPEKLAINGKLHPELRSRGIYKTAVYDSNLDLKGNFNSLALNSLGIDPAWVLLDQVSLSVGVSDLRGISSEVKMVYNNSDYSFTPGVANQDLYPSGILTRVPVQLQEGKLVAGDFDIHFDLKGSEQLFFSPVGSFTQVNLESDTMEPSYEGDFLPKTHSSHGKGFTASWQVLQLNRNYPDAWTGNTYHMEHGNFGVRLMTSIDAYQQTSRASKYAILIIGLTFMVFYFIEMLQGRSVHPLQYSLIGAALIVFYTLLLSISEQTNFDVAYLLASIMTIGLITGFTGSMFRKLGTSLTVAGSLSFLYGFIYVILQSEDNALLMGSLGLFVILAVLMYVSRKVRFDAPRKLVAGEA